MKGIFPLLRAAAASLQNPATGMPARVAVFNAEGSVQLAAPVTPAGYIYGMADTLVGQEFPIVELSIASSRFTAFDYARSEADVLSTINVTVWLESTDGEFAAFYEQAAGYARCVTEVLTQSTSTTGVAPIDSAEVISAAWRFVMVPLDPVADVRALQRWRTGAACQFDLADVWPLP